MNASGSFMSRGASVADTEADCGASSVGAGVADTEADCGASSVGAGVADTEADCGASSVGAGVAVGLEQPNSNAIAKKTPQYNGFNTEALPD
jgi:hypothetical protein